MTSPMNEALRAFAAGTPVEDLAPAATSTPPTEETPTPPDTGQGAGRQSVPSPSPSPSMGDLLRALAGS